MSQNLKLKVDGLYTNPNQFSEIPSGSLSKANNAVIDKGGVIESRRGFKKYGTQLGANHSVNSIHSYRDKLIVHHDDSTLSYDSDGLGTWVDYAGTVNKQNAIEIKSVNQNGNFYFTSSTGVKKLDSITSSIALAGVVKALDITTATTGASGFLAHNTAVAYRTVWGKRDANNNLLIGAPSGRSIAINSTGGTRNISVTIYIPDTVDTDYFYQIYRSNAVDYQAEPNDELQLVYEGNPTSGEITAKSLTITDITPDTLKGAFLYTSSSQEGILQSNEQPPLAKDICLYKNMIFFGNTETKQNKVITYIGGLSNDDTITLDGITYTAKAAENFASAQFKLFTAGTASQNIQDTMQSFVKCVNSYATNTSVYAYYVSGYNDLPGAVYIEDRSLSGSVWTISSNVGSSFNPDISTASSSTNNDTPHRVYYSKQFQPEAVPSLNYFDIGSSEYAILRIVPLRDSVFVFKEDGVFRILGEDPTSLRYAIFDNTAKIIGAETVVELNNTIFAYSDQGIISISDNGIQPMARPIEDQLLPLEIFTDFEIISFGCAYESDRKYIFATQSSSGGTYCTQLYVYNIFTNAWTRWVINCESMAVFDNKLYYGFDGYIYQERKTYSLNDYQDDEHAITITNVTGNVITYTGYTSATSGMLVKQGEIETLIATADSTTTATLEDATGLTTGAATIYELIDVEIEWSKNDCGNPGELKHFREATFLFRERSTKIFEVGFSTNFISIPEYTIIEPEYEGGWSEFAWGGLAWGGSDTAKPVPFRTLVPQEMTRAHWIFIQCRSRKAKSSFGVSGISLMFSRMSERFQ